MRILKLKRRQLNECSTGILLLPELNLHTIERPWIEAEGCRAGKPFESCIPYGLYELVPHSSDKYGNVWALANPDLGVYYEERDCQYDTDRFLCLLHVANWAYQLEGCIAPGIGATIDDKDRFMVTKSGDAMDLLRAAIRNHGYTHLEITAL